MNLALPRRRTLALLAVLVPLGAAFIYVAFRSGPLAPIAVTITEVENRAINPALFGVGTVEAQYTFKIGPTSAGRVKLVNVDAGDRVRSGQLLAEMDPVDLDSRVQAQDAALNRARAAVGAAEAQLSDQVARYAYADTQSRRYAGLQRAGAASEEASEAKRQEAQVAEAGLKAGRANLEVARQEVVRLESERDVLLRQRQNLRLTAPQDGLVASRHADPGTTVVAGEPVVEVIDPTRCWINVRFDQLRSAGLQEGLPARITLRSQPGRSMEGRVLRVEPVADAVTEEMLAKIVFSSVPEMLPPIGELAEVTVALPSLPAGPVVPNSSVQRVGGRLGTWLIEEGDLRFAPIVAGATDLDGRVQVLSGVGLGDRVVVYSQRSLNERARVKLVDSLPGAAR